MGAGKFLAKKDQFATFLGIKILKDMGVSGIDVKYYDSWQSVVSGVVKGEVDVGFLYKDFYDQLSNLSRRNIEVLYVSESKLFSHLFMVSPERKELRDKLLGALFSLNVYFFLFTTRVPHPPNLSFLKRVDRVTLIP